MAEKYIVLTGATGFIGQYLLRDLLLSQTPVAVIARPHRGQSLADRIESLLAPFELRTNTRLARPVCIEGDLSRPELGVGSRDREWLADHAGQMLHNAGNVSFQSTTDGEPWRTNVEGTRRVIDLCRETGIETLHYMSTAFVCGDRQGVIHEGERDCGQRFDSEYERSKFTAETLLTEAGFEKLTVLRPSAVVGDFRTGFTSTYHGFYLFIQFTDLARRRAGASHGEPWLHPVRLFADEQRNFCLVPVDWVSRTTCEIVCDPALHGETYHLTPTEPTSAEECEAALQQYFNYTGVEFVGEPGEEGVVYNEVEELFYQAISTAEHRYWTGHPTFDSRNTQRALPHLPCPRIDASSLIPMIDFAVKNRFGKRRRAPRRNSERLA